MELKKGPRERGRKLHECAGKFAGKLYGLKESPQERGRKQIIFIVLAFPFGQLKEGLRERGRKLAFNLIFNFHYFLIEKRSPRKGTKTELPFAQMSPYVSREDLRGRGRVLDLLDEEVSL